MNSNEADEDQDTTLVQIRLAPETHTHGRSGDTIQRVLTRARRLVASRSRYSETADETNADLILTVHHRECSLIARRPDRAGATGMWRLRYDAIVPGSAAKQFGEWFERLLDDLGGEADTGARRSDWTP